MTSEAELEWRLPPMSLLDDVELRRVHESLAFLNLTRGSMIDSYQMAADGPFISSVYFIDDKYLVEIRVAGQKELSFDLVPRGRVLNLRAEFSSLAQGAVEAPAAIVPTDAAPATSTPAAESPASNLAVLPAKDTKVVVFQLRHTDGLVTEMSYFGDDRDDWLRYVLAIYPKELLL